MQRDAVPGDALHVRHPGIIIERRVVILVLFDHRENAGRGLAPLDAGRHRRARNPAIGVIERDLLALDRHDRHDRLAGLARRHRLGRRRSARLLRFGVGAQRGQSGGRREHHHDGRLPTPCRHGGLRRLEPIYHAMPRLKCPFAPPPSTPPICSRGFLGISARCNSQSLIYDSPCMRKGSPHLKFSRSRHAYPADRCVFSRAEQITNRPRWPSIYR